MLFMISIMVAGSVGTPVPSDQLLPSTPHLEIDIQGKYLAHRAMFTQNGCDRSEISPILFKWRPLAASSGAPNEVNLLARFSFAAWLSKILVAFGKLLDFTLSARGAKQPIFFLRARQSEDALVNSPTSDFLLGSSKPQFSCVC
ncbi:hypothetical protein M514_07004 [Trichuris suis]|uniref:Uncharacterized protein n=1 Tax=Trichuris suis TaxID=68888 RepID=A0A085N6U2_9BILA|nr:hypothetical protein M514_07004 [Trichuris suis]